GDDAVASRSGHARGVPVVQDRELVARREESGQPALATRLEDGVEVRPASAVAARVERPAAVEDEAAVRPRERARRREGPPTARVARAEDLVLGLVGKDPGGPGDGAGDGRHPRGRRAAPCDLREYVALGPEVELVAAEALRHEHAEDAGLAQRLEVLGE